MFRSLLVPLDLSPSLTRVVERAALLPLARGARLTLLHVVPRGLPQGARRRAEGDARAALEAVAKELARALPRGSAIRRAVKVGAPAAEIAGYADPAKVELVVMGRGKGRALRDAFLGSTAERVIRQCWRPALVVRQPPRGPYRRPALALDIDQAARGAIASLLRLLPPPRPRVAVIHAYDAPLLGQTYPSLSGDEAVTYREHYRQKALRDLAELLAAGLAHAGVPPEDAPSWKTHVRFGSPRSTIPREVEKAGADLLALGTRGRSGAAHALLGTIAGDVLREVACDVLVVPPGRGGA